MGKHSSGGWFGSGDNRSDLTRGKAGESQRPRIPAERVLTGDNAAPLQDASPRRAGIESAPARLRAERDRRRKRTKNIVLGVLLVFVLIVLAGGAALFAYAQQLQTNITVKDAQKLAPDLVQAKPGEPFNILLLGADYRKGDSAFRTDTVVIARIDPQQKKVWMISIPRDTRVLIPGHGYQKINAAHAFGGPDLALKTVKEFTGLPISHYMEVNFLGFEDAVNAMGGVWVTVPQAINDKRAASQSVRQRAAKIAAGYQKLDGEHALTFVRSRDGYADQDISRMKAQQIFFKAVADQLAKNTDVPKTIRVVNSITPYIQTDMSLMDLMKTALAMKGAGAKNLYTATLTGPWKTPFIWTDEVKKAEIINAFEHGEPFTAAMAPSALKAASDNLAQTATTGTVKPSTVKITVKNGAGTAGWGAQAATILKSKGFAVKSVSNANQSVYKVTLVVYKKNKAAAEAVAATLMPGTKIVQSRGLYSSPTEILVVVGKDWDMTKIPAAPVTQ
jgi:LCP family protein required for cell wall assembly